MKRIYLAFLFISLSLTLPAQQGKRVYISLDVSGSMTGNKYVLANYTTQMIVSLCDDDDEVSMIVYGQEECLSKNNKPLSVIQKPMNSLKFGRPKSRVSQFDDIIGFNNVYRPSENGQNWLFVIGDGQWGTEGREYKSDRKKFAEFVQEGKLNVCYLQTGYSLSEDNDFTQFAKEFGVIDIRKSDTNPSTIKEGCDHFARKILGFSEVPLKIKKTGQKGISIKTEMPLKGFYLVYQDEVTPERLPKVEKITVGSNTMQAKLKGIPTTIPLKSNGGEVNLSGCVYYVEGNIYTKTEIEVNFDKGIIPANITIYPIVKEVEFSSAVVTPIGRPLEQLDSHTRTICRNENTALVRIELSKASQENLAEGLLQKTTVVVKANNKEYTTRYKNGSFECEIDLIEDETPYYAECDCPGYFKRITPITKILKGDCPPAKPEKLDVEERPVADLGTITFEQLKNEDIAFTINDSLTHEALNPELFDITFDIDEGFMYEEPKVRIENGVIHLELRPKGDWCECLFPTTLNVKMISTPKDEAFQEYGKNYVQMVFPLQAEVIKDHPWLSRCLWVIVTLVALLLCIIYLRMLLKKNRFHKYARVKNLYYMEDEPKEIEKNGHPLRRKGFAAWFSRWLNPFGDEKNTVSFIRPRTRAITFTASPSKMRILMASTSFDANTMVIPNYTPKVNSKKGQRGMKDEEPIGISSGTSIEIKNVQAGETTRLGHLKFIVQGKDDEGGYRFFIGLLLFLAVIAFILLLGLLIKSFI